MQTEQKIHMRSILDNGLKCNVLIYNNTHENRYLKD